LNFLFKCLGNQMTLVLTWRKKTKVAFDEKAVRCTSRRNVNENTTCAFVVENPHKVRTKQFQTFCEKQRPRAEMPLGYVRAYELETW
jgi:hypothetical protein